MQYSTYKPLTIVFKLISNRYMTKKRDLIYSLHHSRSFGEAAGPISYHRNMIMNIFLSSSGSVERIYLSTDLLRNIGGRGVKLAPLSDFKQFPNCPCTIVISKTPSEIKR